MPYSLQQAHTFRLFNSMTKMGAFPLSLCVCECACVIGNRIECTFINWKWMEKATFILRLLLLLLPLVLPNGFWGLHCWKLQTLFVVTSISQSVLYNCKSNKNDQIFLPSFISFSLPQTFANNFVCAHCVSFNVDKVSEWSAYMPCVCVHTRCGGSRNRLADQIPPGYERSKRRKQETSVRCNGQGYLQWWHVYWDKLRWRYNKIFSFLVNRISASGTFIWMQQNVQCIYTNILCAHALCTRANYCEIFVWLFYYPIFGVENQKLMFFWMDQKLIWYEPRNCIASFCRKKADSFQIFFQSFPFLNLIHKISSFFR